MLKLDMDNVSSVLIQMEVKSMIQKYISPIDNCEFDYQIVNGNLSYRTEGTDWQDFILEDKRAYSQQEYAEFLSLLGGN